MQIEEAKQHIEIFKMALMSKQCLGEQELEEYKLCKSIDTVLNELDKKDNYIETMHKEFDRLEGIEDNTSMLLKELVETKEHNRQLGLEIARLNNRCKKLDREAQSYLEEMVGNEGLKERTIKGLEFEIEQKDKIIDLLADDLRYYEGMGQNDLFCFDTCNHCEYCDKELCKERIKEFYMKKASEEDDAVGR